MQHPCEDPTCAACFLDDVCERCGEAREGDEGMAEVCPPPGAAAASLYVHAEPCAMELVAQGWSVA